MRKMARPTPYCYLLALTIQVLGVIFLSFSKYDLFIATSFRRALPTHQKQAELSDADLLQAIH